MRKVKTYQPNQGQSQVKGLAEESRPWQAQTATPHNEESHQQDPRAQPLVGVRWQSWKP